MFGPATGWPRTIISPSSLLPLIYLFASCYFMLSYLSLLVSTKKLRVAVLLLGLAPGLACAQTTSFAYTGQPQTYTVPAGITRIEVVASGAAGGESEASCAASAVSAGLPCFCTREKCDWLCC